MKNKIKGIVLAGGMGTRLYPLTKVTNKHLLPIGGEPMIFYPLRRLIEAGVNDIMIVTGVEHCGGMMTLLGSGKELGCSLTYKVQDETDGIAGALKLCKDFVGNSSCLVILGDNIFKENLTTHIDSFLTNKEDCKVFFKKVKDPKRYGIGVFNDKNLEKIEEKPEIPKSDLACVGVYMYSNKVFDIISSAKKSDRGEYEITSINNVLLEKYKTNYTILNDVWVDAGTMDSYHNTNWLMFKEGV